jgi:hypothetical protein
LYPLNASEAMYERGIQEKEVKEIKGYEGDEGKEERG